MEATPRPPPRHAATGDRAATGCRAAVRERAVAGRPADGGPIGHDERRGRRVLHRRVVVGRGRGPRAPRRRAVPLAARQRAERGQSGSARPPMKPTRCWWLAIALVTLGACGQDKTTALDIKLEVTGALDQVRIDSVTLGPSAVSLTGEQTLFPAMPSRMLKSGDVLTLWFKDTTDKKTVVVTATGRLCGRDATA